MIIQAKYYSFYSFPNFIVQAISTRASGSIKDKVCFNRVNINAFCDLLQIQPEKVFFPEQKHSGNVKIILKNIKHDLTNTDGLITNAKNVFLAIVTADCYPILLYDPVKEVAGVAHAGYKGILSGIVDNVIASFIALGSKPEDMQAGIGPGIGLCCYNVPYERIELFLDRFPRYRYIYLDKGNHYQLDLSSVIEQSLISSGIKKAAIEKSNICTKHSIDNFFSFRGDTKTSFGEFVSLIGIRS